ncbi:Predicted kinase, aminoglycoside phosphotransferase (APT) family [Blastococcus aggregatus]|uniref:Predicted kinase, aminoglycoside phosphotransferase (APT) family n=1 Tax=Blastococcus aggregatus TaxID=38502 RepID=A0A285VAC2_9ACTN|nr:phosphotransferase family protein [Blastococcus aggregatus]SOC50963.1 Predicted kinase, aminoglycoside phosphotransferase (APT) family [Blastococcus aggregatus]
MTGRSVVDDLAARLADRLSALAGSPVRVHGLARLSGGASRETWAFTAEGADGSHRQLILRSGAGTGGVALRVEGVAMGAAARAGVPVPEVVDAGDDGGALEHSYLVMARVEGETIPRRLLRDEQFAVVRPRLVTELGAVLARLHAVPLDQLPGVDPAGDPLTRLHTDYLGDGPPPPGLALGLRWLAENRTEPGPESLVHGDYRLGNLMIGPEGLTAVLDWELVHIGDPLEDLGWLCAKVWRFGSPLAAGGLGTREQLLDAYAEVAGWRPTAAQLQWWELHATVRWGLMCRVMAERHLSGAEPSVELAAIGRRACEQEFDVLLALGLAEPETAEGVAAPPEGGADLYGRPSAAELVAATRTFLTDSVRPETTGRTAFHAQVAVNVLAMVERELRLGDAARARHRAALDGLDCADDAALSRAISAGALDDRWDEVLDVVRAGVRDRLLVANPRHLALPG